MSDRFSDSDAAREALSALSDGEAQSPEVARACAAWRDQADARATWHAYQVIGDVMRSDDLAHASAGGAFLSKFRERLAQEPVVLAPSAAQVSAGRPQAAMAGASVPTSASPAPVLKRRAWAGPMAVAAGFVAVVGALMSSQILPVGAPGQGEVLAQSGRAFPVTDLSLAGNGQWTANGFVSDPLRAQSVAFGGDPSFERPATLSIIRDPRLDEALAMEQAEQGGAERSFADQRALTRQVVFDGR